MRNIIVGLPVVALLYGVIYVMSLLPIYVFAAVLLLGGAWLAGAILNDMRQNLIDAVEGDG